MKRALIAGALLCAIATDSHSRCVSVDLPVSGRIVSSRGGPVEGAVIYIEWKEIGDLQRQALVAVTDSDGRFRAQLSFYPWRESKWFWQGYRCDRPPPILEYTVGVGGHVSQHGTVQSKYEGTELSTSLRLLP